MPTPFIQNLAYRDSGPQHGSTEVLLPTTTHHTVLFVDDEPHVLDGLRRGLRKAPYTVLCARSAEQAFVSLRARTVDVVVSDHDMPGMTGTTFLAQVRQEFPATARCLLTGKPTLTIALQAINEGAISRFLLKPCHPHEVHLMLREVLQQHDLLIAAKRLLDAVQNAATAQAQLERRYPGITHVRRDTGGAIVAAPEALSVEDLIAQLRHEADRVTARRQGVAEHDAEDA